MSRRITAVLLALGLLLTACGGPDAEALLEGAPDALEAAGSSRFEMRVTAVGDGVDSAYSATGEQDFDAGTMRMEANLGVDDSSTETLALGNVMYMRSPMFALFTGDDETWVRIDLEESGRAAGLDVDSLVEGNTGPAALVQQLRGAAESVDEVGSEDVRGISTTHLRVIVDTGRAIEDSPAEVREQLRAFAETSGLPAQYPMEVWIDDDGLPRRLSTVVEVEDEMVGTVTQQTVLELFDFGIPVRVAEPADDEMVELRELLEDLAVLEESLGLEDGAEPGAGGEPEAGGDPEDLDDPDGSDGG